MTVLEDLAGCPWRTFLSRVLRLELPPDSLGDLPGVDPLTLGSVVHRVLERIAKQALAGAPADLDAAWGRDPVPVRWPDAETLEALVRDCAESVAIFASMTPTSTRPDGIRAGGVFRRGPITRRSEH